MGHYLIDIMAPHILLRTQTVSRVIFTYRKSFSNMCPSLESSDSVLFPWTVEFLVVLMLWWWLFSYYMSRREVPSNLSWPTDRWNFLCFSLPYSWKLLGLKLQEHASTCSLGQILESSRRLHLSPAEQPPRQDLVLTHRPVVCDENLHCQQSEPLRGSFLISRDKCKNCKDEYCGLSVGFHRLLYLQLLISGA